MGTMKESRVAPAFLGPDGSQAEIGDYLLDLIDGQFPGDFTMNPGRDRRGRHRLDTGDGRSGVEAGMHQLRGDLGAMGVNRISQFLPAGDEPVIVQQKGIGDILGADGCILGNDQADSALGPGSVVIDQNGRGCSIGGAEIASHGRHDNPVFDFHAADPNRFEQMFYLLHISSGSMRPAAASV